MSAVASPSLAQSDTPELPRPGSKVREVDGRLVRPCSTCKKIKPLEEFPLNGRRSDGSRRRDTRCKACTVIRMRAAYQKRRADPEKMQQERAKKASWNRDWRRRNPEAARAAQERYFAKVRADPERHARHLESTRIAYRLRRERETGGSVDDVRSISARHAAEESRTRVPVAPLVMLIDDIAARAALDRGAIYDPRAVDAALGTVCARADLNDRVLYRWRVGEDPTVALERAEVVIEALDAFWWEVWTAETVRRPLFVAASYRWRDKRLPSGKMGRYRERTRTVVYGDQGPDLFELERIRRAFEGEPPEPKPALRVVRFGGAS